MPNYTKWLQYNVLLILTCIGLPVALSGQQDNVTVFQHVFVPDSSATMLPDRTVVVRAGIIELVTDDRNYTPPTGSLVINGAQRFLVPGLWDMHIHVSSIGKEGLSALLKNGVTSARDMGSELADIKAISGTSPQVFFAGPMLESGPNWRALQQAGGQEAVEKTRVPIWSAEDAAVAIDSLAAQGIQFVKVRTVINENVYLAIGEAARRHGLGIAGHPVVWLRAMIQAGQRSVEHFAWPEIEMASGESRDSLISKVVQAKIAIVPTLVVLYNSLLASGAARAQWPQPVDGVGPHLLQDWREQAVHAGDSSGWAEQRPKSIAALKNMYKGGVRILPGTDAGVFLIPPGAALHDELELLVSAIGMSHREAFLSATLWPAQFMNARDRLGTIEAGKDADMLLLEGDPTIDIQNSRRIVLVVTKGHITWR